MRMKKPGRKRGRRLGSKVATTPAMLAASRTNAWKHGRYARVVSPQEARNALLERSVPGASAVLGRFSDAFRDAEGFAMGFPSEIREHLLAWIDDEVAHRGRLPRG